MATLSCVRPISTNSQKTVRALPARTAPVLYNLEDDPDEMRDLGSDPNYEHIRNHLISRIFEHWDPEYVLKESADADRDIRLITRWGQAIQPTLPDSVPVPDDAEDIECL